MDKEERRERREQLEYICDSSDLNFLDADRDVQAATAGSHDFEVARRKRDVARTRMFETARNLDNE